MINRACGGPLNIQQFEEFTVNSFIPAWIIGAPIIGLLILSFSFKGPSAMGGSLPRPSGKELDQPRDPSAPLSDPMHPAAPRRIV